MKSLLPHQLLQKHLRLAVFRILPDADLSQVLVRICPNPTFGDYQCSALIGLAKQRKMSSVQLARDVASQLAEIMNSDINDFEIGIHFEIAGPGFLNFRISEWAVANQLMRALRGEHLFFSKTAQPRSVVVDFSSPNVAKPMHVGHIRSTILGDSLARLLRLLGHRVVTDNHIGDWGTQFGMLLVGWKTLLDKAALDRDAISELERVYKTINSQCDEAKPTYRAATHEAARAELVKLQAGDAENLAIWREMIRLSQIQFDDIYGRLGVKFDHALGESFYNPRLQPVVDDLVGKAIARESEGAKCVFSDGKLPPKEDPFLIQRDGEWVANPQLIQKRDGGFNYATTDLATIAHRLETWQPAEIVYVTDGRQQLHFQQLFHTFRRWHPELSNTVKLAHVWFGSILGDDGKPLKTRSGENVKLAELLDEAEERAFKVVSAKSAELAEPQRREIARVIGLGAVKYADLSPNRQSDYIFSWDKMLALSGNTAPYLQYAYARIKSIFRKARETSAAQLSPGDVLVSAPQEFTLAKHLLNFGIVLEAAAEEYRPNFICTYLFELAGHFTSFYENCPVLKAEAVEVRASRLQLCDLTARVLKQGLEILGIEVVEQM